MGRSKPCKTCGIIVNLRRMPHGKYVAFEGYETAHKCSGKRASVAATKSESLSHSTSNLTFSVSPQQEERRNNILDNLQFVDIPDDSQRENTSHVSIKSVYDEEVLEEVFQQTEQDPSKVQKVLTAIADHRVLRIKYKSAKSTLIRSIEPILKNNMLCYAFCRYRKDFRWFRIDRMLDVEILPETFKPKIATTLNIVPPRPYYYPTPPNKNISVTSTTQSSISGNSNTVIFWIMLLIIIFGIVALERC